MTEERRGAVKKHAVNGTKLLAAIGALTTAINGYGGLLEQQEQILLVMSSKINALSEKVAYLDGRIAGQTHELAEESAHNRMQPVSDIVISEDDLVDVEEGDDGEGYGRPEPEEDDDVATEEDSDVFSGSTAVEVAVEDAPKKPSHKKNRRRRRPKRIKDLAYQQIPVNLENLGQFQEQIQKQGVAK